MRTSIKSSRSSRSWIRRPAATSAYEWRVEEPEHALELVERLPQLPAVHAVDWPRGKPVRVVTIGSASGALNVKTERDWFGCRASPGSMKA